MMHIDGLMVGLKVLEVFGICFFVGGYVGVGMAVAHWRVNFKEWLKPEKRDWWFLMFITCCGVAAFWIHQFRVP